MSEKQGKYQRSISVTVNNAGHQCTVEARLTLADFLRGELGLTGTHLGCEHGICGACTVLLDGKPVRSCILFAVQADGRHIRTVEDLAEDGHLHPLQEAFCEHGGLQCGFCTPGFLLTALDLLERYPNPSTEEIREGLAGNLCRCTGYQSIIASVKAAAEKMRRDKEVAGAT